MGNLVKGLREIEGGRNGIQRERQSFELQLVLLEDLDDPLQPFLNYIEWTQVNFPQGNTPELTELLEKCTSHFRDCPYYKNDPRYLKVWMEYIKLSDSPREIFVYLSNKDIGTQLATYYEHFATYLQSQNNYQEATEIFQLGIKNNARPLTRLKRNFDNFIRQQNLDLHLTIVTNPLALKRGLPVLGDSHSSSLVKKQKFEIFQDTSDKSILQLLDDEDIKEPGSIVTRIKENVIQPTKWSGETIPQKKPFLNRSDSLMQKPKIQVYQDLDNFDDIQYNETNVKGETITIVQVPGKRKEKIQVNLDLLYPSNSEECCMIEIIAKSRNMVDLIKTDLHIDQENVQHENYKSIENGNNRKHINESGENITIQLNNNDTLFNLNRSPTMTAYSNFAKNEVMNMFNLASHNIKSDDEHDKTDFTNLTGFVTETIYPTNQLEHEKTPPTDKEDNEGDDHTSTTIEGDNEFIANAQDMKLRESQLSNLAILLDVYPGYHNFNTMQNKVTQFKELFVNKKPIMNGSRSAMIDFCGEEIYCLRNCLGEGGFGVVFLVESGTKREFKALKIETPASKWEFYILSQIQRRLMGEKSKKYFIEPVSLYNFQDESYLFLEYCPQSTLLDLINYYKDNHNGMEEVLCIYITLELIRAVTAMHNIGILHCDLKADNCMISFSNLDEGDQLHDDYNKFGLNGWSLKSIKLIDFGRSIDLKLFDDEVRFNSSWKTDEQDCPQMRDNRPWKFEADYYGMAAIIHTLLFGTYIKVKREDNHVHLETPLKRYWQNEIWNPLFDLLLNPYEHDDTGLPITEELEFQERKLERWLEANSRNKNLKQILTSTEYDLNLRRKKLEGR